ncbi:DUF1853 family protein [Tenacibaculum sp. UWU-22]|uniref:DUF1853 family protein n=1 Tax=Tenacibaculum sp. UWU-22 TaxID=3234187 RepID=UPI0034DB6428
MSQKIKSIQLQYQGFSQTPFLWQKKDFFGLEQFENTPIKTSTYNAKNLQKLRLGKLVERFVSFELEQNPSIKILAENIQIKQNNITLGELDCIFTQQNKPIHLEIVYKFYLLDTTKKDELTCWIGPNKQDTLIQKLTKLKKKQLPLLYSAECEKYLQSLGLNSSKFKQYVYFKAQLFVPLSHYKPPFSFITINNQCIYGFYIKPKQLQQFNNCKFYIPNKHNWLVKPYSHVNWLTFNHFTNAVDVFLDEKNTPLCWLKKPNGELFKFFIIWW